MKRNRKALLYVILISLFVIMGITGCSYDDDDDIGEHITPWGFVLYESGVEVARYYQGVLSEESLIEVNTDAMTGHISVHFIDDEGTEYDPGDLESLNDGNHWLELTIQDTTVASIWRHDQSAGEDWGFHITGNSDGTTGLHLSLVHVDHYGFIMSDEVWVTVVSGDGGTVEHGPPFGLRIVEEESGIELARVTADSISGNITVNEGMSTDHLELYVFDSDGIEFQPVVPVHSLSGNIADGSIAEFESHAEDDEPWCFQIKGITTGETELELDIMHDDHVGWGEALPVPVIVE